MNRLSCCVMFIMTVFFGSHLVAFESKTSQHISEANKHAKNGDFKNSLDSLNVQIAQKPSDSRAYKIRGNVYYAMGDFQNALRDLDYVVSLHPNSANAYVDRSIVHSSLGNHHQAMLDIEKALVLSPRSVFALAVKAKIQENSSNY